MLSNDATAGASPENGTRRCSFEMPNYPTSVQHLTPHRTTNIDANVSDLTVGSDVGPRLAQSTSSRTQDDAESISQVHLPRPKRSSSPSPPPPPKTKWSWASRISQSPLLRTLLRTLRLSIVYALKSKIPGLQDEEPKKTAFLRSRKNALVHCMVHLLPVLAALTVIVINLFEYYIGGELSGETGQDFEKLGAIQFAAKLHELLMLASLGVVVFTAIRRELALGDGLPFGAVFAGLEIDSISTLWSMELWSLILDTRSKSKAAKQRIVFLIALVLICILLGVSVGPSTANLMRPRLQNWPAGGTTFWIDATPDTLYPLKLSATPELDQCKSSTNPACPFSDYQVIAQDFMSMWPNLGDMDTMPEMIYLPSSHALRSMSFRFRSITTNGSRTLWPSAFSTVTATPAAISDALSYIGGLWAYAAANADNRKRFAFRRDAFYTLDTFQPIANVRCDPLTFTSTDSQDIEISFADFGSISPNANGGFGKEADYSYLAPNNLTTLTEAQQYVLSGDEPSILWLDDEDLRSGTAASLNAIVLPPQDLFLVQTYYCCSVDTRRAPLTVESSRNAPKMVTGAPDAWYTVGTLEDSWPRIHPSPQWAAYISSHILLANSSSGTSTSPFAELLQAGGMSGPNAKSLSYNADFIVESAIASLLASGMARTSYNHSIAGSLRGQKDPIDLWSGGLWAEELLPKKSMDYGGQAYEIQQEDAASVTKFEVRVEVYGYAYSWRGMVQIAAICTLLVYALLAVAHSAYSGLTGWYSVCWDSAPEITVLALNSEPTDAMKNTGAGIRTMRTYRQPIQIVSKDGKLEIVPTYDKYKGRKITEGEKYG